MFPSRLRRRHIHAKVERLVRVIGVLDALPFDESAVQEEARDERASDRNTALVSEDLAHVLGRYLHGTQHDG